VRKVPILILFFNDISIINYDLVQDGERKGLVILTGGYNE